MESKNSFVTVLAWIFIVGSGFSSLISIAQVVMITTVFSGDAFQAITEDTAASATFLEQYIHLFFYGFFL